MIRTGAYRGKLYRALNPLYAREPLSGKGAERYGGRFNPKGMPALYCSLTALTALREANQVGNLQPTTLVSYEADIEGVFDGRDEAALRAAEQIRFKPALQQGQAVDFPAVAHIVFQLAF